MKKSTNFLDVAKRYKKNEITIEEALKLTSMKRWTFFRTINKLDFPRKKHTSKLKKVTKQDIINLMNTTDLSISEIAKKLDISHSAAYRRLKEKEND